jgi:repressor LexA
MKEITGRQGRILAFLARFVRERGFPPTIREIRDAFHLKSNRGVVDHLRALERKGYIKREPGISRGIEIIGGARPVGPALEASSRAIAYPVVGNIAAGRPEPPAEHPGSALLLDERLFAERGDFIVEVKGDSMIDDHIVPGDLLVVRKKETCESGALVVALIDGEATVKRYVRSGDRIELCPANPKYEPIVLSGSEARECSILGTVVGIIRALPSGGAARRKPFSG